MAICKQCLEFFEPDDYEILEDRQEDICPTCKYLTPEVSAAIDSDLEALPQEPEEDEQDDSDDEEDDMTEFVEEESDVEE